MMAAVPLPAISDRPPGNPFATRFTRPGAIPPLDAHGRPLDLKPVVSCLRRLRTAAITGGHGHGKTTLLLAIADSMAAAGAVVRVLRVRRWRDVFVAWRTVLTAPAGSVVCVDGWDSLGPPRRPLAWAARRLDRLLLVTSHRADGLPVLRHCDTTTDLLVAIVARLPDHGGSIAPTDVTDAFELTAGNVRESLYDLYDRYERTTAAVRQSART